MALSKEQKAEMDFKFNATNKLSAEQVSKMRPADIRELSFSIDNLDELVDYLKELDKRKMATN